MTTPDPDEVLARTQWDLFWLPQDATFVDRPELLALTCPRDQLFLNAVVRTRGPRDRLPALVEEVSTLHAGRRSRWTVGPLEPVAELERALSEGGYGRGDEHDGYSIATDALPARPARGITTRAVADMDDLVAWLEVVGRAFGEVRIGPMAELEQDLAACTGPQSRVHRVIACDADSGTPLSGGGLTLFPSLSFGLLWAGGTVPEGRGRGAYSAGLAARAAFARARGIDRVGLFARIHSSGPIVAAQGFQRHGRTTFWVRSA